MRALNWSGFLFLHLPDKPICDDSNRKTKCSQTQHRNKTPKNFAQISDGVNVTITHRCQVETAHHIAAGILEKASGWALFSIK